MNKKKVIVLSSILVLIIAIGAYFLFTKDKNSSNDNNNSTYIDKGSSTSQSSSLIDKSSSSTSQSTSISSSAGTTDKSSSTKKLTDKEVITYFVNYYTTYDLTVNSVMARTDNLKSVMTDTAFKNAEIQAKSDTMLAMVTKWVNNKEIGTSSGDVELASQKYKSATSTQNQDNKSQYYIELNYISTNPASKVKTDMVQLLWLTVEDGKISDVDVVRTKIVE